MVRVVEPESKRIGFDVKADTREEVRITRPNREAMRVYRTLGTIHLYAKPISGLAVILALLVVPMITLPGMVILVLVAEVYLLDWTYSKFSLIRDSRSSISNESTERSPEDEIDRKMARTGPKDQFLK
jgi:hypothetical protein